MGEIKNNFCIRIDVVGDKQNLFLSFNERRDALTFIIYPAKVNQKLEFNGVVSSCFVILGNKGQLPPKHLWAIFPEVL